MIEQSNRKFYLIVLLVSIGLAGIVSFYASSSTDEWHQDCEKDERYFNSGTLEYFKNWNF